MAALPESATGVAATAEAFVAAPAAVSAGSAGDGGAFWANAGPIDDARTRAAILKPRDISLFIIGMESGPLAGSFANGVET